MLVRGRAGDFQTMNRRTLLAGLGGLFALSALPALAQDKTYTLIPKYTAGEMVKNKLEVIYNFKYKDKDGKPLSLPGLNGESMKMKIHSTSVTKTKSITADGTVTLSTQTRNGSMEMMGRVTELPSSEMTMTVGKDGKSLKVDTTKVDPSATQFMDMFQFDKLSSNGFMPPEKPVKIGDKWEQDMAGVMQGMAMKVVNEAMAVERIGSVDTLRIKQTMAGTMSLNMGKNGAPSKEKVEGGLTIAGDFLGEFIYNISVAEARMIKYAGTFTADMKMELPKETAAQSPFGSTMNMSMEGTMNQTLLSIGKISDEPAPKKAVAPKKPATKKPKKS